MKAPHVRAIAYSVIVALGGLIFGLDAALISGTVDYIRSEFSLSADQVGWVVAAPGLGVLPALFVTGYLCDLYGRKKTLIGIASLYVVSAVWSAFAPSYMNLFAARFLGGLAFTSLALASMYIGEIAPTKWRGKLVAICQINTVIGLSGAYFVNLLIFRASEMQADWVNQWAIEENIWRYMLGSEIVPALLWLSLLFFIEESPRWLMFRGRQEEARKALAHVVPAEEVDEQIQAMRTSLHNEGAAPPLRQQLRELFGPRMRTAILVATTIAIAQQATGINAIYFYAPTVFRQLGAGADVAFQQSVVLGLVSLFFAVLALFFVDRLGRRPLVIGGILWIVASLGLCAYGFSQATYELAEEDMAKLPDGLSAGELSSLVGERFDSDIVFKKALSDTLGEERSRKFENALLERAIDLPAGMVLAGILSFMAAFQFSVGPVMWVLFSEIFPTSVRGIAIPLFQFVTGTTSWFVQYSFLEALETYGATAVFVSFMAIPLLGMIILAWALPETKNLTIEQIQQAFVSSGERRDSAAQVS